MKFHWHIKLHCNEKQFIYFSIFLTGICLALSWLATCAVFKLVCWVLNQFGIMQIANWTVAFSWNIATALWLIITLVSSILFPSNKND